MNNAELEKLTDNTDIPKGALSEDQVAAWLCQIDERKKAEKEWRHDARKITQLYEGGKREQSPFNILYSNTETLAPALYNNTPRPAAGRRYKDKDPLGLATANVINRVLNFTMDSNDLDEPGFDAAAEHAILQALVPGRGIVRFKYASDFEDDVETESLLQLTPQQIPNTPSEGENLQLPEEGELAEDAGEHEVPQRVTNERVCIELVEWDRVIVGFSKNWYTVPWIAFEHHMVESEIKDNFPGFENKLNYACLEQEEGEPKPDDKRKVAVVYEVWDKSSRTVMFLTPSLKEQELKIVPDPLGLSGFYPMPKPLSFFTRVSKMVPQPIYNLYRDQAEELNIVTRRIKYITEALKVRGVYPQELEEINQLVGADDNTLVPITNTLSFEGKALRDMIMLMPLTELSTVLQQLYQQRQGIKQVIYEITGISDILRGSSVASETATAQNIKNQWGTLRLKKAQKQVVLWCRESLRIISEIAGKKFQLETFQQMTELPYATDEQVQQAQMQMQQWQAQQAAQPPQPQQPGQPPQPPAQPPQQIVDILATPKWSDILGVLQNSIGTEYRIDIETNSTIADDLAEDQKNIGDLLNSLSQFLNGVAPLIENGSMPFEVAKSIMLGMVRKMAMGPEVEEALDKMQAPNPPQPEGQQPPPVDPNIQLQAQVDRQKLEIELELAQQQLTQSRQEHMQNMQIMQAELKLKQEELLVKTEELNQRRQANAEKFQQQMAMTKAKAAVKPQQPTSQE